MHKIDDNLTKVSTRITQAAMAASRDPKGICLLAVSKTQGADALRLAYQYGQHCFGESYLQEALDKQRQLHDLNITWHFIGPIQSNKTRDIAENFDWVHSIDRFKIARRLNEQRPPEKPPLNVCIQVNVDAENNKSGVKLDEIPALAKAVISLPHLRLRGLMAIPSPRNNSDEQKYAFNAIQTALTKLREALYSRDKDLPLDTLSMGMSGDLEVAIHAGATIVRVGTDIFGPRQRV